jgi:hypothetical protein
MTRTSWMVTLLAVVLAAPASAQTSVDKTVPFELDKWYELNVKEGPITLHRIRLERSGGGGLKARVTGGEDEYRIPVKVELEYSNITSTSSSARHSSAESSSSRSSWGKADRRRPSTSPRSPSRR